MSAWSPPSGCQCDALHDVVVITGRVENQLGGLALADLVGGVDHHRVLAVRGLEREAPWPERITAEILAQRRARPALAAVSRDFDGADAVAAVPGHAADRELAGFHLGTITMAGDQ